MNKLLALATASALGLTSPAMATVTLGTTDGKPLDNQIFLVGATGQNPVFGTSPKNNSPVNVTFTGNSLMDAKDGFAQISDADPKNPSLFEVIINPDLNFDMMKFALQLTEAGNVQVYYLLAGSGLDPNSFASYTNTCLTCLFTSDNKDNSNYLIQGGVFDGIMIKVSGGDPANLFELKQISYEPAVPEPATWMMMLVGFAGIGGALRYARRRRPQLLAQIA